MIFINCYGRPWLNAWNGRAASLQRVCKFRHRKPQPASPCFRGNAAWFGRREQNWTAMITAPHLGTVIESNILWGVHAWNVKCHVGWCSFPRVACNEYHSDVYEWYDCDSGMLWIVFHHLMKETSLLFFGRNVLFSVWCPYCLTICNSAVVLDISFSVIFFGKYMHETRRRRIIVMSVTFTFEYRLLEIAA
jgi:hypothetical protein